MGFSILIQAKCLCLNMVNFINLSESGLIVQHASTAFDKRLLNMAYKSANWINEKSAYWISAINLICSVLQRI